ncbi:uncharacterized protein HKW66_Vig0139210 [Vigna angularis]|uniref:Uncharacterized protein n=1 Tax=Phaseolus angularis TaxID=3914 RepID=A0A8T0KHE9_PHAAN|nr:uncharacterized protein HKW66_Vig0139210 [Vigna angularis]
MLPLWRPGFQKLYLRQETMCVRIQRVLLLQAVLLIWDRRDKRDCQAHEAQVMNKGFSSTEPSHGSRCSMPSVVSRKVKTRCIFFG